MLQSSPAFYFIYSLRILYTYLLFYLYSLLSPSSTFWIPQWPPPNLISLSHSLSLSLSFVSLSLSFPCSCFITHQAQLVLPIYIWVWDSLWEHGQPTRNCTHKKHWLPPLVAINCQQLFNYWLVCPSQSMQKCWLAWSCAGFMQTSKAIVSL